MTDCDDRSKASPWWSATSGCGVVEECMIMGRERASQWVVLGVPTHVVEGSSSCFLFC
ncbi:hypothetical protein ES288_A01G214800v1 [Gossypium darwinii]|uniref:Uncharacterized protein n=1 Tax=Gossypium darwinii TaxID=34276 RepID=A0A5D2HPV7_GOSDA|nr:hypothetical protein ES288_A01G214800v1 [Gossypium darwinii]